MLYENGGVQSRELSIDDSVGRRILESAIGIINREGYQNLTIRRVAKESGCSNSAIYQRFEDKDALARAVAALQAKPFLIVMDETYSKDLDFCSNLDRITGKMLDKLYSFAPAEIYMQVAYRGALHLDENPFVLRIEDYLKNAITRGEVRVTDIRETAFLISASFWGFVQMLRFNADYDVEAAKKLLKSHNIMLYGGIAATNDEENLWDKLKERGVDVNKALERMKGNKEAYKSFLEEFFEDPDFQNLDKEIGAGNARNAFEYAHGLKGMAANLGLDEIRNRLSILVEILRTGSLKGAEDAYCKVMEACSVVTMLL